jgi:thiosulfate reductase cytochrome b subunit
MINRIPKSKIIWISICISLIFLVSGVLFVKTTSWAKSPLLPEKQPSTLHPTFPLLDEEGENVLDSGKPLSTMNTCGDCHDTTFIAEHSYHTSVGLEEFSAPGEPPNSRPWDTSTGLFGRWNPITYRYLSPEGDPLLDMGTATWIQEIGPRHVGGGPAVISRSGEPLIDLDVGEGGPETHVLDSDTGDTITWDWGESGLVEMNCFLCHTPEPNNEARKDALHNGDFQLANTATLMGTGIVDLVGDSLQWNQDAFQPNGELSEEFINIQDPNNENCGQCHGLVHDELDEPLVTSGCAPERWRTVTTGQIVSGQRLDDSGMNLANKADLHRSWDIHAERLVNCTDCHFALNNPAYYQQDDSSKPEHLVFDPRRLEIGEYLYQPIHQFARGQSAQSNDNPDLTGTMRRCESCHNIDTTHDWLPYNEKHISALSCESCHAPYMYSNAMQTMDWTVLNIGEDRGQIECRGIEGDPRSMNALITGFQPVLLPRQGVDGQVRLAPYNLISSWYWIYGDPPRPVRLIDLQAAWHDGEGYHPDIMDLFDADGDGDLDELELVIDSNEKELLLATRLEALGLTNPRIAGEVQPYSINHNITHGQWATRECQSCHSNDSRIYTPIKLSSNIPGNVMPEFVSDGNTLDYGEMYVNETGELYYSPLAQFKDLYVIGRDRMDWVDKIGSLIFLGTILGVVIHGGLRFITSLRQPKHTPELKEVYMYSVYERLWHWLQTFVILLLIFTGLIIHKPDTFGMFSFRYVVLVHNVAAAILLINATLALFYHLASGEIRQYFPRPRGFFDQAITQAKYYLQGIFKNDEHPFEKIPEKKLNPLQQVTYFATLNVLLPLQIITGLLMWGAQRWPALAAMLGGLPFFGPFHTLIAWLFASFVVMHVYLTTTGPTPLANIKAMMIGWDEIEVHRGDEPEPPSTTEEELAV